MGVEPGKLQFHFGDLTPQSEIFLGWGGGVTLALPKEGGIKPAWVSISACHTLIFVAADDVLIDPSVGGFLWGDVPLPKFLWGIDFFWGAHPPIEKN